MPSNRRRKHTISNKLKKRPGKDIDQIHEEMKPNKAAKLLNQEVDLDLPGDGQFYCIECARYFIDEKTRRGHQKSKNGAQYFCFLTVPRNINLATTLVFKLHKNRLRTLKEVPYTIKESEAAAGHGHYEHVTVKSKVSFKMVVVEA
ncbi:unnamed protein product [Angiostrongylus costaricensis]|uniref:Zf-C2H2_jaz domain-containing protein n=1 Tax=Angiostrongylus costaricensis TaxID=334426 RepID=A0A0R3PXJ1_ANGCS|nr:unnamed protein product [Angiostrongylus costaricensis]